jgi:hypothetical protein
MSLCCQSFELRLLIGFCKRFFCFFFISRLLSELFKISLSYQTIILSWLQPPSWFLTRCVIWSKQLFPWYWFDYTGCYTLFASCKICVWPTPFIYHYDYQLYTLYLISVFFFFLNIFTEMWQVTGYWQRTINNLSQVMKNVVNIKLYQVHLGRQELDSLH